jgi:DivIVA domain-containing protein
VLAPHDIRSQQFPSTRRGYDSSEVRAFLEQVADDVAELTEKLAQRERMGDRYDQVAAEVATVLRTAHEEAARTRATADEASNRQRDEASLFAAELRRQAEEERDEAKRLLVRSQERASSLVREAEQQATTIVRSAESLARSRANQVLAQAQRRLDRIKREEQRTQQRLLTAQSDLGGIIERVAERDQVIDLTQSIGKVEEDLDSIRVAPKSEPDPVSAMVRAAVGRAVASSAENET